MYIDYCNLQPTTFKNGPGYGLEYYGDELISIYPDVYYLEDSVYFEARALSSEDKRLAILDIEVI